MRRSGVSPLKDRLRSGVTLCAALSLAAWIGPFSPATGNAEEAELSGGTGFSDQLAQERIVVPSRVDAIQRGQTVLERKRPELDPIGLPVGGFTFFPALNVTQEYNDNIFAASTGEIDDFITRIAPRARLESNWNNHRLAFFGSGVFGRHWDNGAEDFEDFTVGSSGRLDIQRNTRLRGRVEFQNKHEERGSPDDVGGVEPTEYDTYVGMLEGFHRFNRLSLTLGGSVEKIDFDDVATGGGGVINNDDRDRRHTKASVRAGYNLMPNYEGFVKTSYLMTNYDDAIDDAGLDRDSDGFEVVAGVAIDFGGITFGDFYAGYRTQDYDDVLLSTVSGPVVGADLTWNVTPLTTILGTISREIRESTLGDGMGSFASGRFHSTVGVAAQHELLRNLLLGADISYVNDDYKGINRTDNVFRFGVNARYMMYRNFYINGGYRLRNKDSDVAGADFLENVLYVRLQAQY